MCKFGYIYSVNYYGNTKNGIYEKFLLPRRKSMFMPSVRKYLYTKVNKMGSKDH